MSAVIVRRIEDDGEEHRVDTTGKSERQHERVFNGMMMQLDHDRFYLDDDPPLIDESPTVDGGIAP